MTVLLCRPKRLLFLGAVLLVGNCCLAFAPNAKRRSIQSLFPRLHSTKQQQSSSQQEKGVDDTASTTTEEERAAFLARCRQLCEERNLPFEKIKNARDLASVGTSQKIKPGRIFRMGRLSDATDKDIELLHNKLNFQTLVDLRSPTELKDDATLLRDEVFDGYTDMVWKEAKRGKDGCLRELEKGVFPFKKHFWNRQNMHNDEYNSHASATNNDDEDEYDEVVEDEEEDFELCTLDCDDPKSVSASQYRTDRKERHFVSVMNELKYVKGTVSKVRKRDMAKSILKSPGAIVSKRVRHSAKAPFLNVINDGGLPMLNELLLHWGAPGIKYVLELVSDRNRHPIAFYCAAGKDRTGLITALILSLCSVSDEDIVEDYMLSANVYAEMNDHKAMVGALSQRSLDPKTFLGAPPQVMRDTLRAIKETYGSVPEYCNWIGFGPEQQEKLRRACMDE